MRIILLIMIGFSLSVANVVVDKKTGLMWQDNYEARSVIKIWSEAKQYCKNLTLDGYNDWFLPTYKELQTITDKSRYNPAIREEFKNTKLSSYYWSSSSYVPDSRGAWAVEFKYGSSNAAPKTLSYNVRCVRARQPETLNFEKTVQSYMKQEFDAIVKLTKELKLIRGEFETTKEFQARVTKIKQEKKQLIVEYKRQVVRVKKHVIQKALEIKWGKPILINLHYDADNGYFVSDISFEVKKDFHKKVTIKVPRKNARDFKAHFSYLKPQAIFDYDGKSVSLKYIKVPYKNRNYLAQFKGIDLGDTRVAVNISNKYDVDKFLKLFDRIH